jgi:hypothetical protein
MVLLVCSVLSALTTISGISMTSAYTGRAKYTNRIARKIRFKLMWFMNDGIMIILAVEFFILKIERRFIYPQKSVKSAFYSFLIEKGVLWAIFYCAGGVIAE